MSELRKGREERNDKSTIMRVFIRGIPYERDLRDDQN